MTREILYDVLKAYRKLEALHVENTTSIEKESLITLEESPRGTVRMTIDTRPFLGVNYISVADALNFIHTDLKNQGAATTLTRKSLAFSYDDARSVYHRVKNPTRNDIFYDRPVLTFSLPLATAVTTLERLYETAADRYLKEAKAKSDAIAYQLSTHAQLITRLDPNRRQKALANLQQTSSLLLNHTY